ncbi:MAG: SRPBCC domain-containing protein [Burkholderiaceae bacterium]
MNAPERFTLNLSRFVRAPREKVFDAFVTEASLRAWHCPRGMSVASCGVDARVGGAWRTEMKARDGSRFTVGGQYKQLQRPERLVYTWKWEGEHGPMSDLETLIEVDFVEKDGGTELRMTHSGFPTAAARDSHSQGWSSCFNRLNDLLDARGSAGTLTLLGDARSTYTRTARMGFAEKGVAYTLQPCAPHSPEILAVHPFGRIPALRDGSIDIWETRAILQYLDESFDSPVSLTPGRIADRTSCEQWVSAVNCYLYDTMIRRYVLQMIFPKGEGGQPDRGVIDGALKEMPAQLAALDRAYERGDFLAGETLSFADLFIAPILAYVQAMPEGVQLLADRAHIQRAQATIRQRASFIATDPQRPT